MTPPCLRGPHRRLLAGALLVSALLLALGSCSGVQKREVCDNSLDDDGNGLADCADPDCAGQPQCPLPDAGYWGTCSKCGQACVDQAACLQQGYSHDSPLPFCVGGRCVSYDDAVDVHVRLDTMNTWAGLGISPQTVATRFIKKTALDGSAVSCNTIKAVATTTTPPWTQDKAGLIESIGRFQIQGFDTRRLINPQLGQGVSINYVKVNLGGDFLIWEEFWAGPPDSVTKLGSGNRLGWGCFEAPADTTPVLREDHCPSGVSDAGGNCRQFRLTMPGPQ